MMTSLRKLLTNSGMWVLENPFNACAVWCALSTVRIVRPVLLRRNVNSEYHGAILEDNFIPIF
jgi:hypothetical protein